MTCAFCKKEIPKGAQIFQHKIKWEGRPMRLKYTCSQECAEKFVHGEPPKEK